MLLLAYDIPVYRDAFIKVGVSARDFKTLSDLSRFPIIDRHRLVTAYRSRCLHPKYLDQPTYRTCSSGSSGVTLPIEFDPGAVIADTLQGARQLSLQSAWKVASDSLVTHYYTCPWWTDNISGRWRSAFVSSLIAADKATTILRDLRPDVLTGYPSLLQQLATEVQPGELQLQLIITNSEQSTRQERDQLANVFSCAVLDEYSSEELTRIAIELPDKKYYVNEDSVFLEILHPKTREPVADGEWGEAVATSLLNVAMPFIRYATGDFVRRPRKVGSPWAGVGWGQLDAIGGRMLDSFIRPDGELVPSGAMLDVVYRACGDVGVCVDRFELVQVSTSEARLNVLPSRGTKPETVSAFARRVEELLAFVLETRVRLVVGACEPMAISHRKWKRRPIRRDFASRS